MTTNILLGFIGQGFVGRSYANSFEDRGYPVTRYALEKEYIMNRDRIRECDIVFIAVPTPTEDGKFNDRHVRDALSLVGRGKVAVIKSTVPPGVTRKLAEEFPYLIVMHNPEFLREKFAREDVDNPFRTLVGIVDESAHRPHGERLLSILPAAPHSVICTVEEAEFLKYLHNTLGYAFIVYMNILHDVAEAHGVRWDIVKESILRNPWFPEKYIDPVHKGGRGAGGHCFIKDFAAFRELYQNCLPADTEGIDLLRAFERKNIQLLRRSGKDLGMLLGVYGDE